MHPPAAPPAALLLLAILSTPACDTGSTGSSSPFAGLTGKCVCVTIKRSDEMRCGILGEATAAGVTLRTAAGRTVFPAAEIKQMEEVNGGCYHETRGMSDD